MHLRTRLVIGALGVGLFIGHDGTAADLSRSEICKSLGPDAPYLVVKYNGAIALLIPSRGAAEEGCRPDRLAGHAIGVSGNHGKADVFVSKAYAQERCRALKLDGASLSLACEGGTVLFLEPTLKEPALPKAVTVAASSPNRFVILAYSAGSARVATVRRSERYGPNLELWSIEVEGYAADVITCTDSGSNAINATLQSLAAVVEAQTFRPMATFAVCDALMLSIDHSTSQATLNDKGATRHIKIANLPAFESQIARLSKPSHQAAYRVAAYLACYSEAVLLLHARLGDVLKDIGRAPNPLTLATCS